jgi:hypothetical protein
MKNRPEGVAGADWPACLLTRLREGGFVHEKHISIAPNASRRSQTKAARPMGTDVPP